jgi:hypothetical protein
MRRRADRATACRSRDADDAPTSGGNEFIPDEANLGDCLSSLPRPGCGSDLRGGWRQALTFAILMLGMAFIGWRIFRSVRQRDRQLEAAASASSSAPAQRQMPARSTTTSVGVEENTQP